MAEALVVVTVEYDNDYVQADVCIQSIYKTLCESNRENIDGSFIVHYSALQYITRVASSSSSRKWQY